MTKYLKPKSAVPSAVLTKADAAKILGITPAAVALLSNRGELPSIRTVGGVRLFNAGDVEALGIERDARRRAAVRARAHRR